MSDTSKTSKRPHPWAIGITVVIVVFLITTITGVIIISQQEYSLVTENYYEKDQTYQQEIDVRERTRALGERPVIDYDSEAKTCTVRFPEREAYGGIDGTLTFFRISSARGDRNHPLALSAEGVQHVSVSDLQSGQWIVKLRWTENDKEFFLEQRLYLQ